MIEILQRILAHKFAERALVILILINAITLGLETSKPVMEEWGNVLHTIDKIILAIFVVELAARLWVWRFFKDGWNVFDFIIVAISLIPASESLQVLRSLRILRVLRLVTIVPSLKRVVGALISALPGMGSIMLLMGLIFYVGAVMTTKMFGDAEFGAGKDKLFGTLGDSLLTLFQIMTLDAWADNILRPLLDKHPYAWLFFIPFVLISAFMALNLFIGVVVSALEAEGDAARKAEAAGEPLPASPLTNADVIMEIRKLREEIEALQGERNRS
ncbi:MAG: ion transporter [Alphaproteobacteria bacterium]|nr:ion transporter [Alphaproteobacteria bacterium]